EPAYPVPTTLVIAGLINHVFDKPYALLVPLHIPAGLAKGAPFPISLKTQYLVCTAALCVPETAQAHLSLTIGDGEADAVRSKQFDAWRQALPRPLGSPAVFERKGKDIRFAFPLPSAVAMKSPHLFIETQDAITNGAKQVFVRKN